MAAPRNTWTLLRSAFRPSSSPYLRQLLHRAQKRTIAGVGDAPAITREAEKTGFAKLWNSNVGPKTVHFWAPIMKVSLAFMPFAGGEGRGDVEIRKELMGRRTGYWAAVLVHGEEREGVATDEIYTPDRHPRTHPGRAQHKQSRPSTTKHDKSTEY